MEIRIQFPSSGYQIEGRLHAAASRAVVITHPHSLYGGNMHNPVVEAITDAFMDNGFTTLRFNFRGVEGSQGRYDEGIGEQEDVRQAVNYLEQQGYEPVALSGYSFGTWVNAHCAAKHRPDVTMTMVSPPTAFMDFREIHQLPGLKAVITGSRDDIAPPDMLKRMVPLWNPDASLDVLPGADHFFLEHLRALTATLNATIPNCHPIQSG